MALLIEDALPVVKYGGLNSAQSVSFTGAVSMTGATTSGAITAATGDITVTTGNIVLSANSAGISFTGTAANGGLLTNLYNTTPTTLSGTQKDIKILIGTVPYYWTVYPTKA